MNVCVSMNVSVILRVRMSVNECAYKSLGECMCQFEFQ